MAIRKMSSVSIGPTASRLAVWDEKLPLSRASTNPMDTTGLSQNNKGTEAARMPPTATIAKQRLRPSSVGSRVSSIVGGRVCVAVSMTTCSCRRTRKRRPAGKRRGCHGPAPTCWPSQWRLSCGQPGAEPAMGDHVGTSAGIEPSGLHGVVRAGRLVGMDEVRRPPPAVARDEVAALSGNQLACMRNLAGQLCRAQLMQPGEVEIAAGLR
jgi:hypothetical protein